MKNFLRRHLLMLLFSCCSFLLAQAQSALNFDGTNDYVNGTNLAALNSKAQFTTEAWVTTTVGTGYRVLMGKGTDFEIAIFDPNNIYCRVKNGTDAYGYTTSNPLASFNTWVHIACVYDGSQTGNANRLKIYINGVLQTLTFSGTILATTATNANSLILGSAGATQFWSGSMDEVRVWSRALPQCEIQNNRNCELSGTQTGLAAYYKFNQNSGTSLTDASGNSNTGTLTNFALTGTTSNWVTTGGVTTGTTCTALPTPSVAVAASPSGAITAGTSVTFTATPTTPTYVWQNNGATISGATAATYTSTGLANGNIITCVMTPSAEICPSATTATSTGITMTVTTVLSVELLDFKATPSVSGNLLTWTTANEVNNKEFQVERLMVSGDWLILGFVNAQNKAATYDFTDNQPLSTSYYRLRQLDNDGKETFSKVVSVSIKGNSKLKVYPNPVSNILTVETDNKDVFQILNLLGQQVLSGKTAQRIDVSALPQGAYFLKVGTEQVKFVKQ